MTTDVTPYPSETLSELVLSPVGTLSVFDFQTPIPYPFGEERGGDLVTSMPAGVAAAERAGAQVVVSTWNDPLGTITTGERLCQLLDSFGNLVGLRQAP